MAHETYKDLLVKSSALLSPSMPDTVGWKVRHINAVIYPSKQEYPIVGMLEAWLSYADIHLARFESEIGEDYVLGKEWEAIGDAIRGLLNGECGRLDCGTLDGVILNAMKQAKIETATK